MKKKNIGIKHISTSLFMVFLPFTMLCSESEKDPSQLSLKDRLNFFSNKVGKEGQQGRLQPGKVGTNSQNKNKNNDPTRYRGSVAPRIQDPHYNYSSNSVVPLDQSPGFEFGKPSGRRRKFKASEDQLQQSSQNEMAQESDVSNSTNLLNSLNDEEIIVVENDSDEEERQVRLQEELNRLADAVLQEEKLLQEVQEIAKNADAMRIEKIPAPLEQLNTKKTKLHQQEKKLTEYDLERIHDAHIYGFDIENMKTSLSHAYGFDQKFVEAIIRNLKDHEALKKVAEANGQTLEIILGILDTFRTKASDQRRYPCNLIETLLTKNFDASGEYIRHYREGGQDFRCTHDPYEAHLCAPLTAMAMRFLNNEHLLYSKILPRRYYINTIEQLIPLVIKTLRMEEDRDVNQIIVDANAAAEKLLNEPNPQDSLYNERMIQRRELADVILQQAAEAQNIWYVPLNNNSPVMSDVPEETPEQKREGKLKVQEQPQTNSDSYVIPREKRPGGGNAVYIRKNDDNKQSAKASVLKAASPAPAASQTTFVPVNPAPKVKTPSPQPALSAPAASVNLVAPVESLQNVIENSYSATKTGFESDDDE